MPPRVARLRRAGDVGAGLELEGFEVVGGVDDEAGDGGLGGLHLVEAAPVVVEVLDGGFVREGEVLVVVQDPAGVAGEQDRAFVEAGPEAHGAGRGAGEVDQEDRAVLEEVEAVVEGAVGRGLGDVDELDLQVLAEAARVDAAGAGQVLLALLVPFALVDEDGGVGEGFEAADVLGT